MNLVLKYGKEYLIKHSWKKDSNLSMFKNNDHNTFGYGLYFLDDAIRVQNSISKDWERYTERSNG